MEILVTREPTDEKTLRALADAWFGDMVKGAIDIARGTLALGGDWHMDANVKLIEDGSSQEDVWGFNVYPEKRGDDAIEYISLINIRPRQGNRDMELQDPTLRRKVRETVAHAIPFLGL
ncbi:MAG: hypothetical protein KGI41_02415 [Patescibacteria group bacterium]|nr:hypothetical protein [Patescibacteria group bacterium]MDE1966068.1 hypothetical protein [Patescibacteria group bacterium]